jgi:hypothetical protein
MVILYDRYNLPDDVFDVIFATKQQKVVAKLLINEIKKKSGEFDKPQMSDFATRLHEGNMVTEIDDPEFKGKKVKISYNKRQFYDRILTPMKGMGLVDYNLYKKTYHISAQFNEDMVNIGTMWIREIARPTT